MVDLKEQQSHCVRLKAPKGFSVLLLPSRQSSRFCTPVCEHLCFTKTNVSFKIIDELVEVQREWFHGVDEVAAPLISAFYTISLNFSMSDVFSLNSSLLSEFSGVKLCIKMESFFLFSDALYAVNLDVTLIILNRHKSGKLNGTMKFNGHIY